MATKKQKADERAEAIKQLRKILKPGDRVRCILRHVSSSGMSRRIDFYKLKGGETIFLTGYIGKAVGYTHHREGGLVVGGCGMDMGFSVVYNLGATLWPTGTKRPHGTRNGESDSSGGYALQHEWL